jgi:hypothetical protein
MKKKIELKRAKRHEAIKMKTVTCEGFRPEGIDWDGKDEFGDKLGRGVYIYKLAIINSENQKAEKTEKLVILN